VLTIQPVVENAILHGIKPKVGGGTVTLSLVETPTHWHVTVADDGVGFDPAAAPEAGSIGLGNVRRRLSRFPGCGIEIESAPGRGTQVVLSYWKESENFLANSIQHSQ
jgi:sensor histidine kinase YesM